MKSIYIDLDQTLFNDLDRKITIINQLAKGNGYTNIPTYEEVLRVKNVKKVYDSYGISEVIYRNIRDSEDYYKDMPLIEGSLSAVQALNEKGYLAGYITARSENARAITYNDLLKNGFPEKPVIFRPASIPVESISIWKLEQLQRLHTEEEITIIIDDSVILYNLVSQIGTESIKAILFKGYLTDCEASLDWENINKLLIIDEE